MDIKTFKFSKTIILALIIGVILGVGGYFGASWLGHWIENKNASGTQFGSGIEPAVYWKKSGNLLTGQNAAWDFSWGGTPTSSADFWIDAGSGNVAIPGISGSTQCLHVDTNGIISGTGSDCGAGGATYTATNPLSLVGTAFGIDVASGSGAGALSAANWTTFNGKQDALTFELPLVNVSNTVSASYASANDSGWLSSTDWTTFNNKLSTHLTANDPLWITGTTIDIDYASAGGGGYILGTDWQDYEDHVASTNAHLDWTQDLGAVNINAGNYTDTNTTYTAIDPLFLTGTAFDIDYASQTFGGYLLGSDYETLWGHQASTSAHIDWTHSSNSFESDSTASISGAINFKNLTSCDTIDSDINGLLSCGTDATGASAPDTHGLLNSDIHTDTLLASASIGSLIVGENDGWKELTIGASNSYLQSDGTSASWNDAWIDLGDIQNPTADKTFTFPQDVELTFRSNDNTPVTGEGIFNFESIGAFTGHMVHIHQHTGNPGVAHLLHLEATDTDMLGLAINIVSTSMAFNTLGGLASFGNGVMMDETLTVAGAVTLANTKSCDTIDSSVTGLLSCGTDDDVPEVGDFSALVGGEGIDNNSGTLTLDLTEFDNPTFASGSATQTWTIDLATTDVLLEFGSDIIRTSASWSIDDGVSMSGQLDVGDMVAYGSDITLGATGVKLSGDSDGAITFLGLSAGADENLIMNLDDTTNEIDFTTGTGVIYVDWNTMRLAATGASLSDDFSIGAAGVYFSQDGDGLLSIAGRGDGSDEDLTINFDDVANTIDFGSTTGVTIIDFNSFVITGSYASISDSLTIEGLNVAASRSFQATLGNSQMTSASWAHEEQFLDPFTIKEISCRAKSGTSFQMELLECDANGANCSDVDAAITCAATTTYSDGTLTNPTIDALDTVVVSTSQGDISGAVETGFIRFWGYYNQ